MQEKFKWDKFILDCFLCFGIAIISPFIYSYLIKSDDLRWLLCPIQWLFNIDIHTITKLVLFATYLYYILYYHFTK